MDLSQPVSVLQQQRDSLIKLQGTIREVLNNNELGTEARTVLNTELNRITEKAKTLNTTIENRIRDRVQHCKHLKVTAIVDFNRTIYECSECGAVLSELPDGSKIIDKKDVY